MDKFEINPFDRSALTDYKLLAGRSDEFKQIRFILRNSSKQSHRFRHIMITGNRGVGKTSFLNLIDAESITNSLFPIRINLTASNSENSTVFFWHIFSQAVNAFFNKGLLDGKGGAIDLAIQSIIHHKGISEPANWVFRTPILYKNYLSNNSIVFDFDKFISDLQELRKVLIEENGDVFNSKAKILFLVDEAQHIYSCSKIVEEIRYIIQHPDLGIGFVFAGDSSFLSQSWEEVFGGSLRDFEVCNLNYFKDVESVEDYFTKSLQSIGWTTAEIEDTLFYRFKTACSNIFNLTSGKPAWINTIAMKMFERCMKKESRVLRFDKNAQNDVKTILESSGELDQIKLEIIDQLTPKYKKWLSIIFNSELSSLNQVYFFGKFIFTDDNFIGKEEFYKLCQFIIDKRLIIILSQNAINKLGYNIEKKEITNYDLPYIAFGPNCDTIKQWLQISSEGKFQFSFSNPANIFIKYVNAELVIDRNNTVIMFSFFKSECDNIRFSNIIKNINSKQLQISDFTYDGLSNLYKACKVFEKTNRSEILYGILRNKTSGTIRVWNVYNFDYNNKPIGFNYLAKRIEKFISNVDCFNVDKFNYALELYIDIIEKPDIAYLQQLIVKSEDKKKIGIILDDKGEFLWRTYVKDSDIDSSYSVANFFFELYEEGYDLKINYLNNAAYVFLVKSEFKKAYALLNEAKKKIQNEELDISEKESESLIFYNLAIYESMNKNYIGAVNGFKYIIDQFPRIEKIENLAAVLHILKLDEKNEIIIQEVKEGNEEFPEINIINFAENNIKIIEDSKVI